MWPFIDHIEVISAAALSAIMICVAKARALAGAGGEEGYEQLSGGSREDDQLRSML
jgi:hypothetical protein